MNNKKPNTEFKKPINFLSDNAQVKRDFRSTCKKPKLDVKLTPQVFSNASTSNIDPLDDLWDDDFTEDVVEECFLLASQAFPEENLQIKPANDDRKVQHKSTIISNTEANRVTRTSLLSIRAPSSTFKPRQPSNFLTEISDNSTAGPSSLLCVTSTSNDSPICKLSDSLSRTASLTTKSLKVPQSNSFLRTSSGGQLSARFPGSSKSSQTFVRTSSAGTLPSNVGSIKSVPIIKSQNQSRGVSGSITGYQPTTGIGKANLVTKTSLSTAQRTEFPSFTSQDKYQSHDGAQNSMQEVVDKLKAENEKFKENLLAKEGEVSILRSQLQQLKEQSEIQRINTFKSMEEQEKKYKEMLQKYEKDLEHANTELQFKAIETATVETRSRALEGPSNLKLKEPHPSVVSKEVDFESSFKERTFTTSKLTNQLNADVDAPMKSPTSKLKEMFPKVKSKEDFLKFISGDHHIAFGLDELTITERRKGPVFADLVANYINEEPPAEVTWINYVRRSEKFRSSPEMTSDLNASVMALQSHPKFIKTCAPAVQRLIAEEDINTKSSQELIKEILMQCQIILVRYLRILRMMSFVQSAEEWASLNEKLTKGVRKKALRGDENLLSSKPLYKKEEGLESRRALGLMEALCRTSNHACDIILGKERLVPSDKIKEHIANYRKQTTAVRKKKKFDYLKKLKKFSDFHCKNIKVISRKHSKSGSSDEEEIHVRKPKYMKLVNRTDVPSTSGLQTNNMKGKPTLSSKSDSESGESSSTEFDFFKMHEQSGLKTGILNSENKDDNEAVPLSQTIRPSQPEPSIISEHKMEGLLIPIENEKIKAADVVFTKFTWKRYGFLKILRNIALTISAQRRTSECTGILLCLMKTLNAACKNSILTGIGMEFTCDIIREMVFACPGVEIVILIFELLQKLSEYDTVGNILCHLSGSKNLIERRFYKGVYFLRGSCILQVLLLLLPKTYDSTDLQQHMCEVIVDWLYRLIYYKREKLKWLASYRKEWDGCTCKAKLVQCLIILMYDYFMVAGKEALCKLGKVNRNVIETVFHGLTVLYILMLSDQMTGVYVESVGGYYTVLLNELNKIQDELALDLNEKELLSDLLQIETANANKPKLKDKPIVMTDDEWTGKINYSEMSQEWLDIVTEIHFPDSSDSIITS